MVIGWDNGVVRMKREKLRRTIALAAIEVLRNHTMTYPNVKRHVLPVLKMYNVKRETEITYEDIKQAILIVQRARAQKPVHFWYRRDQAGRDARKRFLLDDLALPDS